MNNTTQILNDITKLKKRLLKLNSDYEIKEKELNRKVIELQSMCTHDEVYRHEEYISGSYLEREKYIITTKCKVCDKVLKTETKTGYYN